MTLRHRRSMLRFRTRLAVATLAGALIALFCSPAEAKIYYVNRGVKYHIGDNRYERSEDSQFMDAYPVVGQEWIQAFKVSQADTVKVQIEHIWGVDDCPYCKVLVAIDKHDMGRLYAENNHRPFDTLEPLAMKVEPGKVYYLRITSYGTDEVDDVTVEGVSVQSEKADIIFLQPGPVLQALDGPMPAVRENVQAGQDPCADLDASQRWLALKPGTPMAVQSAGDQAQTSQPLAEIQPGQVLSFSFQVQPLSAGKDLVSQELALVVDDGQASGWVYSYGPGESRPGHGNLLLNGRYSSKAFDPGALPPQTWVNAKLGWCRDGCVHLSINGQEVSQSFSREGSLLPVRLKALNLGVQLKTNE